MKYLKVFDFIMTAKPAHLAWLGLTVYVVGVDTLLIIHERKGKKEFYTMSTAFRSALAHPVRRWPVIVAWTLLTLHLFDFFFPEKIRQYDPVRLVGGRVAARRSQEESE